MTQTNEGYTSRRLSGNKGDIFFLFLLLAFLCITTVSEALAASVSPSTLSYSASSSSPMPSPQTVTFSKNSIVTKSWTASGNAPWMTVSPSTGTISREKDQITVNVNASGLAAGTYNGTLNIAIGGQISMVSVTLVVSGGTATPTSTSGGTTSTSGGTTSTSGGTTPTPSILLNPVSLSFSGTAGGAVPLAQTFNIVNPTGGTLTWTLAEPASWLGLNITSGTTTTEVDAISASVSTTGLTAGTYNTAITVTASGSTNSPQIIPVILTLSAPTTNGTAALTWQPSTDTSLAGYNLYIGTQAGVYGPPTSVGLNTSYTVGSLTGGKTYYFTVTAVSSAGTESQHSNEVYKTIQ
jgi:fibronectin type III domain protein/BACON domain-containing protein